jgi:outer membrane protein assembly factor BamD
MLFLLGLCLAGCSSKETTTNLSAEERFQHAKGLFDNEDYLEAINEFSIVTLQFQASPYADDAQFYLGECRFKRHEYLLAANEYNILRRNMAASPLVPDAQYKIGLCYYDLSPKSSLDQQYTKKAIEELQTFVEYYPGNEHAADASEKIRELNTRLAMKQYNSARLYARMEYYKSAIAYYDDVIEKYHDTEYAPLAHLGKVEALIARRKYADADAELKRFYERFPNSVLRSEADKLKQTISKELESKSQAGGKEFGTSPDTRRAAEVMPGTGR